MIKSMTNFTRSDGSRGIASALVEFVTPPALAKVQPHHLSVCLSIYIYMFM